MPATADWRNPSAHSKMNQPFEWSNLDDAAEWLAGRTGKHWGARDVLNAAICYPVGDNPDGASNRCTAIGVALPQGHKIKSAVQDVGEGRAYLENLKKQGLLPKARKYEPVVFDPLRFSSSQGMFALLQTQARQLLAAGWVEVATARKWTLTLPDDTWRFDVIDPPFVARLENAGIPRCWLVELAARWKADHPAGPVCADQAARWEDGHPVGPVGDDQGARPVDEAQPAADLQSRVRQRAAEIAREASEANAPLSSMTAVASKLETEAWKHKNYGGNDPIYIGGKGPHKVSWYKAQLKGWQPEKIGRPKKK